jgi:hypothetical protein
MNKNEQILLRVWRALPKPIQAIVVVVAAVVGLILSIEVM